MQTPSPNSFAVDTMLVPTGSPPFTPPEETPGSPGNGDFTNPLDLLQDSDRERYLKLISPSARKIVTGQSSDETPVSFFHAVAPMLHQWLQENYEIANDAEPMPRNQVYDDYTAFSKRLNLKLLNPATFGKLLRLAFPTVEIRRLGTRTAAKYHYLHFRRRAVPISVSSSFNPEAWLKAHTSERNGHVSILRRKRRRAASSHDTDQGESLGEDDTTPSSTSPDTASPSQSTPSPSAPASQTATPKSGKRGSKRLKTEPDKPAPAVSTAMTAVAAPVAEAVAIAPSAPVEVAKPGLSGQYYVGLPPVAFFSAPAPATAAAVAFAEASGPATAVTPVPSQPIVLPEFVVDPLISLPYVVVMEFANYYREHNQVLVDAIVRGQYDVVPLRINAFWETLQFHFAHLLQSAEMVEHIMRYDDLVVAVLCEALLPNPLDERVTMATTRPSLVSFRAFLVRLDTVVEEAMRSAPPDLVSRKVSQIRTRIQPVLLPRVGVSLLASDVAALLRHPVALAELKAQWRGASILHARLHLNWLNSVPGNGFSEASMSEMLSELARQLDWLLLGNGIGEGTAPISLSRWVRWMDIIVNDKIVVKKGNSETLRLEWAVVCSTLRQELFIMPAMGHLNGTGGVAMVSNIGLGGFETIIAFLTQYLSFLLSPLQRSAYAVSTYPNMGYQQLRYTPSLESLHHAAPIAAVPACAPPAGYFTVPAFATGPAMALSTATVPVPMQVNLALTPQTAPTAALPTAAVARNLATVDTW